MSPAEVEILAQRVAAAELRLKAKEEEKIHLSQHKKELDAVRTACDQLLHEQKIEFEDQTQALELRVTVLELALRQKEEEEDLRKQVKQHSNSLEAAGRRLRLTRRVIARMIHSMLVAACCGSKREMSAAALS